MLYTDGAGGRTDAVVVHHVRFALITFPDFRSVKANSYSSFSMSIFFHIPVQWYILFIWLLAFIVKVNWSSVYSFHLSCTQAASVSYLPSLLHLVWVFCFWFFLFVLVSCDALLYRRSFFLLLLVCSVSDRPYTDVADFKLTVNAALTEMSFTAAWPNFKTLGSWPWPS